MKNNLQRKINQIAFTLELVISGILIIVISILTFKFLISLTDFSVFEQNNFLNSSLEMAMSLAVGVEFIKMLCKHTPSTVVEVLLFAIARQMVVEHLTSIDTLIGVISIAILFATRKFLFCSSDEISEK